MDIDGKQSTQVASQRTSDLTADAVICGLFYGHKLFLYDPSKQPPSSVMPQVTSWQVIEKNYLHPKFKMVLSGFEYVFEKEPVTRERPYEILRVSVYGGTVFEQQIKLTVVGSDAIREHGAVTVLGHL